MGTARLGSDQQPTVKAAKGNIDMTEEHDGIKYNSDEAFKLLSIVEKAFGHPKLKGILDLAADDLEQMSIDAAAVLVEVKADREAKAAEAAAAAKAENDAQNAKDEEEAKAMAEAAAKAKEEADAKAKEEAVAKAAAEKEKSDAA